MEDPGNINNITYSAFLLKEPLHPAPYTCPPNLRRFYFTIGQESSKEAANENRVTLFGVKHLIINRRYVSNPQNRRGPGDLNPGLGAARKTSQSAIAGTAG